MFLNYDTTCCVFKYSSKEVPKKEQNFKETCCYTDDREKMNCIKIPEAFKVRNKQTKLQEAISKEKFN